MVCKKCGEEIYDNEKCPFCNQIQSEEITNKGGMPFVMKNCDTCGHDYASDNEECLTCPANPFKKTVNDDGTIIRENIKCKKCNKETPEHLRYCIHCGHNNKQNKKHVGIVAIILPLIMLILCFSGTVLVIDKHLQKEETIIVEQEYRERKLHPSNYKSIKFEDGKSFVDLSTTILLDIEEINQLKKEIIFEYFKDPNVELFNERMIAVEEKLNNVIDNIRLLDDKNYPAMKEAKMIMLINHVSPCIEKTIHFSAGVLFNDAKYLQDSTLTELKDDYSEIKAYITLIAQKSGYTSEALEAKMTELNFQAK